MIETARLRLVAWSEAERAPFLAMCADPEVMHDWGGPWDRARAEARFDRYRSAHAERGFDKWALRTRVDDDFIGLCGVSPIWPTLPAAPGLEIGWRLARSAWGRGYATEAARAALYDIFERTDAAEVLSYTLPTNDRSLAVMRRLGLERNAARDFRYETGLPALVFVARRADWARG